MTKVRLNEFEPRGLERGGHASALEIVNDVGDVSGFGDLRFGEPASLVVLGRGMIELEHAHVLGRLESIGEGVETRAQNQNLLHALSNRAARRILREPAAHRDEQAQRPTFRPFLGESDGVVCVRPEDGERKRVGEDEAALENLVRRPASRGADRGSARLSVLHGVRR